MVQVLPSYDPGATFGRAASEGVSKGLENLSNIYYTQKSMTDAQSKFPEGSPMHGFLGLAKSFSMVPGGLDALSSMAGQIYPALQTQALQRQQQGKQQGQPMQQGQPVQTGQPAAQASMQPQPSYSTPQEAQVEGGDPSLFYQQRGLQEDIAPSPVSQTWEINPDYIRNEAMDRSLATGMSFEAAFNQVAKEVELRQAQADQQEKKRGLELKEREERRLIGEKQEERLTQDLEAQNMKDPFFRSLAFTKANDLRKQFPNIKDEELSKRTLAQISPIRDLEANIRNTSVPYWWQPKNMQKRALGELENVTKNYISKFPESMKYQAKQRLATQYMDQGLTYGEAAQFVYPLEKQTQAALKKVQNVPIDIQEIEGTELYNKSRDAFRKQVKPILEKVNDNESLYVMKDILGHHKNAPDLWFNELVQEVGQEKEGGFSEFQNQEMPRLSEPSVPQMLDILANPSFGKFRRLFPTYLKWQ